MNDFHKGAGTNSFENARTNRQNQTEAEAVLWQCLRNRRLSGYKFRRQHPLLEFIVDFYCVECKVVVEVDGAYHGSKDQEEYDQGRTFELEECGIKVIRFSNQEVLQNKEKVLQQIKEQLNP